MKKPLTIEADHMYSLYVAVKHVSDSIESLEGGIRLVASEIDQVAPYVELRTIAVKIESVETNLYLIVEKLTQSNIYASTIAEKLSDIAKSLNSFVDNKLISVT